MPEPITPTAAATMAAAAAAVPVLTLAGVPLGLRPDLLIAGFSGSLAGIVLLNTVPSDGDTWPELFRTTMRRMAVVLVSSLTAGYMVPLALLVANLPDSLLLSGAFALGGGAQSVLAEAIRRLGGGDKP